MGLFEERYVRDDKLSERAKNIVEHKELLDSIEDTDSIWHELYEYTVSNKDPEVLEKVPIKEKAEYVRYSFLCNEPSAVLVRGNLTICRGI